MAVQAFQGLLPQILVLAKARAAALSLRTVIETVNRGRKFDRKIGLLSPQFCDGDIEVRDVSVVTSFYTCGLIHGRYLSHILHAQIILYSTRLRFSFPLVKQRLSLGKCLINLKITLTIL